MKNALVALFVCVLSLCGNAGLVLRAAEPVLVKVIQDKRVILGEVLSDSDDEVELLNLKTGKPETIPKSKLNSSSLKPVPDKDAIVAVGLPRFLAWKIDKLVPAKSFSGKVAEKDDSDLFVTLGAQQGIRVGDRLGVFRGEKPVKDPETGEVLGTRRKKVAVLEVFEVQPRLSSAKLAGESDANVEVGDVVEPLSSKRAVAVLPFSGDDDAAGSYSDKLATELLNAGIPIVERQMLDDVLGELKLQKGEEFDKNQVKTVGGQLGAAALVMGKIVTKGQVSEAQIRLIRVDSGEVLVATSEKLGRQLKAQSSTATEGNAGAKTKGKNTKATFVQQFTFKGEKDVRSQWRLSAPDKIWSIENNTLKFSTPGGEFPNADIDLRYKLHGEVAIEVAGSMNRGSRVTLLFFGESIVVKGVSTFRVHLLRKGSLLTINNNGDISTKQLKESWGDNPSGFKISWGVEHTGGGDCWLAGVGIKATKAEKEASTE